MSVDSLKGSTVLITGAARGIGRCIALALADRGAQLVLAARSTAETPSKALPGTLEDVEAELRAKGVEVLAIRADVSQEADCHRLATATIERFGGCDVLVNNAAVSFLGDFLEVPVRRWNAAFNVNLFAPVLLAQAFLPGMVERGGGRIINISSGSAIGGDDESETPVFQLPYATSKAALERLTTGLHTQYAPKGVGVNCLRIDGLVPTEAVTYSAPQLREFAACTPEEFGEATALVAEQPRSFSGHVLGFADMRALGFLPPQS